MDDREIIFHRIRRVVRHEATHPGAHPGLENDARGARFATSVQAAGGEAHGPLTLTAMARAVLEKSLEWAGPGRIVAEASAARLLVGGAFDRAPIDAEPAEFADVAVAIATGAVGVAEDGAVAVLGREAPHRSLLVLAERLILMLDARRLVTDLHAAFRALPEDALEAHHITWIAGPSKTADIEQTLVLGAHGPRALAVFTYLEEPGKR